MRRIRHQNWIVGKSYRKRILDDNLKGKINLIEDVVIRPGGIIPPHSHKQADEIFYITENEAIMIVGNKKFKVSPGDFIYVDRNEEHSFRNESKKEFKMIVFKINFEKSDAYLKY